MNKQTITLLKILAIIFDIGLFYLFFWMVDRLIFTNGISEWWTFPTVLLSAMGILILGDFLTSAAFDKE